MGDELMVGDQIEVRVRFRSGWAAGFEVAEVDGQHVQVRRVSDGTLLPERTSTRDVRSVPRR